MISDKEPFIHVEHLKKYYPTGKGLFARESKEVKAVDDISFTIFKGEIFGLVGESGCGKSTAGRTILNLTEPTGGRVTFRGVELYNVENQKKIPASQMRQLRQEMQIVFQDPYASLDPRMNIAQIMTEGMKKHHLYQNDTDALDRAGELLELCGLERNVLSKYPHQFSGGQRQRIGIARALSLNPRFIIGDELIASLDVSIKAQILNLLTEMIRRFDLTFLLISHDLSVVRYFCDRVGVMYLGKLVEEISGNRLFTMPVHPYTRALLSAVPPGLPGEKKERILLQGEIPNAVNPPSGCRFHTRCPYVQDICREQIPASHKIEPDHFVICHFAEKLAEKVL